MATDYKRRAEPSPTKRHTPGWVWFVSGVMVGAFACGLAWLKLGPRGPLQAQQVPGMPAQKQPTPRPAEAAAPKAPPPRFDFYKILPESEVVVPKQRPQPATANHPAQSPVPGERESYLLQAGAFSQRDDAERLKASLALLGVEAEIQSAQGSGQQRVYRVRSGPYPSRAALDQARANLQRHGIESIAIKLDG